MHQRRHTRREPRHAANLRTPWVPAFVPAGGRHGQSGDPAQSVVWLAAFHPPQGEVTRNCHGSWSILNSAGTICCLCSLFVDLREFGPIPALWELTSFGGSVRCALLRFVERPYLERSRYFWQGLWRWSARPSLPLINTRRHFMPIRAWWPSYGPV